jgi:hypothetical protein
MDPTGKSLLKLMFNEDESICVHNSKYSYHSIPRNSAMDGRISLISENTNQPTRYCDSKDLIFVAINPMQGFRKDSSATKFRSFLWEIDSGPLKHQIEYLKRIGVPISAQIFSGNKSVHAVTVLDEDLPNEKTWRYLCSWALKILTMCDDKCKNPSRSVRIPGAYREPGKKQRLISIGNRVKLKDFIAWLNKYEHLRPKVREKKRIISGQPDFSRLSPWARAMLTKGITFKNGRNQGWFGLAYDLALAGFSEEQGIEILSQRFTEEDDFKEKEFLTTIRSAFKKVEEVK